MTKSVQAAGPHDDLIGRLLLGRLAYPILQEAATALQSVQAERDVLRVERDRLAEALRIAEEHLVEEQASFDMRWKADMRAIKIWQAANPGNDLVWPDHTKLQVWLMDRATAAEAKLAVAVEALKPFTDLGNAVLAEAPGDADNACFEGVSGTHVVPLKDFRRAREALATIGGGNAD